MFCEKEPKALISTTLWYDRAELAMQGPQEETLKKMLPQKLWLIPKYENTYIILLLWACYQYVQEAREISIKTSVQFQLKMPEGNRMTCK